MILTFNLLSCYRSSTFFISFDMRSVNYWSRLNTLRQSLNDIIVCWLEPTTAIVILILGAGDIGACIPIVHLLSNGAILSRDHLLSDHFNLTHGGFSQLSGHFDAIRPIFRTISNAISHRDRLADSLGRWHGLNTNLRWLFLLIHFLS